MLACDNPAQKVQELLEFRDPIYEVGAHLVVDVDGKTVEAIAEEIVRNYEIIRQGKGKDNE